MTTTTEQHTTADKYTPTTDEIETAFHEFASALETREPGTYENAPEFSNWVEAMHGFRRWLAQEREAAAVDALDQAAEWLRGDMDEPWGMRAATRLEVRAARVRAGESR